MRRFGTFVITLALVATACGGDALTEEEQQAASDVAAAIDAAQPEFLSYLSGDRVDLDCWAESLVGDLGLGTAAAIIDAGSDEDVDGVFAEMTAADRDRAADSFRACVDVNALKEDLIEFAEEDAIRCAVDTMLAPDVFRISFSAIVIGDWDTLDAYQDQLADDCGF